MQLGVRLMLGVLGTALLTGCYASEAVLARASGTPYTAREPDRVVRIVSAARLDDVVSICLEGRRAYAERSARFSVRLSLPPDFQRPSGSGRARAVAALRRVTLPRGTIREPCEPIEGASVGVLPASPVAQLGQGPLRPTASGTDLVWLDQDLIGFLYRSGDRIVESRLEAPPLRQVRSTLWTRPFWALLLPPALVIDTALTPIYILINTRH